MQPRAVTTEHFNDGIKIVQKWYLGQLHCDDGPAVVHTDRGFVTLRAWYQHGKKHRVGGPAVICKHGGGVTKKWYQHDELHHDSGPAFLRKSNEYGESIKIIIKEWYRHGKLHRDGGPAVTRLTGCKYEEHYYHNGELDRDDGPAVIVKKNNVLWSYAWYSRGKKHRVGAPAVVEFHNGDVIARSWYTNGQRDRVGAPAREKFVRGECIYSGWYLNGLRHRDDGPSLTMWNDGVICAQEWCVLGAYVTNERNIVAWYQTSNPRTTSHIFQEFYYATDGNYYAVTCTKCDLGLRESAVRVDKWQIADDLRWLQTSHYYNYCDFAYSVNYDLSGKVAEYKYSDFTAPWIYEILPLPIAEEIEPHLMMRTLPSGAPWAVKSLRN